MAEGFSDSFSLAGGLDLCTAALRNLAPTGEVGAKRRVRIRSAGRLFWAPGIKIQMCDARK